MKRIAPRFGPNGQPTRGRIYAPKHATEGPPVAKATSEPIVTITAVHRWPDGTVKGVHSVRGRTGG